MIEKIIIVPNSGIYYKNGEFYVIDTMRQFYIELIESSMYKIEVSAISLSFQHNHFLKKILHDRLNINVFFKGSRGRLTSIINYFFVFFRIGFTTIIKRNTFLYAFFPGNISMISVLWAIIYNKRFGLYLRGDINSEGKIKSKIYRRLINKAEFCIVTGENLFNEISILNSNTEHVSAMIKYSVNDIKKPLKYLTEKSSFRFLYVGRISKDKGIFELLNAFEQLNKTCNNIELVIIGNIAINEEVKLNLFLKKTENLKVSYLGAIMDAGLLKQEYLKSDCFILSSHHEGFPRVLYEAMIFNIPIITTDLPGIKHEMIHESNCLKYPIGNEIALTKLMSRIIKERSLSNKIREGGYNFMVKYFKTHKTSHAKQVINRIGTEYVN